MNKGFLLLLVTLVQSQSNGVLLSDCNRSEKSHENCDESRLEDWENLDFSDSTNMNRDIEQRFRPYSKRLDSDVLTRRSILDKNFMRFGRSSQGSAPSFGERRLSDSSEPHFLRFDRGLKDSFIRFGRRAHDNFIRFGRGHRDSFLRFGRLSPEDLHRAGKAESFIRFGRANKNFLRFGRGGDEEYYTTNTINREKSDEVPEDYEKFLQDRFPEAIRNGFWREGRNETGTFKNTNEEKGDSDENRDVDMDFVIRLKRSAAGEGEKNIEPTPKPEDSRENESENPGKRSTGFFYGKIPVKYFPRKLSQYYVPGGLPLDGVELSRYYKSNPPFFPNSVQVFE